MRAKWILLSFLLLLPWGRVVAQESGVAEVVNAFNSRYPQEKVFLHFDNTAYYLNEVIWFKAYLLRTDTDSLGSLSRVLYVELVDPGGQVVETKKCLERVATMREGRGVFDYIPPADGKVRACLELKSGEGKTRIFDLPEAALTGFVMHVDASHPDRVT